MTVVFTARICRHPVTTVTGFCFANEKRRTFRDRTYKHTGRTELRSDFSIRLICTVRFRTAPGSLPTPSRVSLSACSIKNRIFKYTCTDPPCSSHRPQKSHFTQPDIIIPPFQDLSNALDCEPIIRRNSNKQLSRMLYCLVLSVFLLLILFLTQKKLEFYTGKTQFCNSQV